MAEVDLQVDAGSWRDMSEKFVFLDESLEYVDQPVAGLARSKVSAQVYRFECVAILPDRLWHWKLWPKDVGASSQWLLSVVEDRRSQSQSVCVGVWMK